MSLLGKSQVMQQIITKDDCFDIYKIMAALTSDPLTTDLIITFKGNGNSMTRITSPESFHMMSIHNFTSDNLWWAWTTNNDIIQSIIQKYNSQYAQWLSKFDQMKALIDEGSKNQFTMDICQVITLLLIGNAPHYTELTSDDFTTDKLSIIGFNDANRVKLGCVACIFKQQNKFWLLEEVTIDDLRTHIHSQEHVTNLQKLKSKSKDNSNTQ